MLIARHRMVNSALVAQFEAGIHALSIHAYTLEQWAKKKGIDQKIPESPDCLG